MLDGGLDPLILKLELGERLLFYNIKTNNKWKVKIVLFFIYLLVLIREGANKSLAHRTSRCRRMGSILSLERGVCSCAELQVFSCYTG